MIGKVLKWGNSYGIRLSKEDVEELGLREGQEVVVEVKTHPEERVDLSHLETFEMGGDLSREHDEVEWA
jgi:antitoxin component of MazEF toxin-antitoxin module